MTTSPQHHDRKRAPRARPWKPYIGDEQLGSFGTFDNAVIAAKDAMAAQPFAFLATVHGPDGAIATVELNEDGSYAVERKA